jgi:CheY-like chemotaxis protein
MEILLQMLGNETCRAHDGAEALTLAESFRPDVVLLDIGMPRMDGYEAARAMRDKPWGGRVVLIALTGWADSADRSRSKEAGFDRHLVKPLDPDELVKLLASFAR